MNNFFKKKNALNRRAFNKISLVTTITVIISMISSIFSISAGAYNFTPEAEGVRLTSEAVYMENLDAEDVILDKNADVQYAPASLTKIMTCVLVLDEFKDDVEDLKKTKVSAGNEAFKELENTFASTAGIEKNEKLSYYDLLCALMIPSACEAANIIAVNIGGSIDGFVEMMNAKAGSLGMKNTVYYNAHGLDLNGNVNMTTCRDQAILCKYAINNYPIFTEITSKYSYTLSNGTTVVNTNSLLDETSDFYYGYVNGIKTGFYDEAGRCLASVATKNGYTYLIVSMKAPAQDKDGNDVMFNCEDHKKLYMWAFENLGYNVFVEENEEITEANVLYGKGADFVTLKPANEVSKIWLNSIDISKVERKITVDKNIVAPVYKNDTLGNLELIYEGETIGSVKLVATSDLPRASVKAEAAVASKFFSSKQFKIALVIIILAVVIYIIVFKAITNKNKRKEQEFIDNK